MVYIQLTMFDTIRDSVYVVINIYEEVKYKSEFNYEIFIFPTLHILSLIAVYLYYLCYFIIKFMFIFYFVIYISNHVKAI